MANMVAASVDSEAKSGNVLAIIAPECVRVPRSCIRYAVYMYSDEKSAVSEAASGMKFLSMNAD